MFTNSYIQIKTLYSQTLNPLKLNTYKEYFSIYLDHIHRFSIFISTVLSNLRMVGWSTLPIRTADSLSVKRNFQLRNSNVPPICTADPECSVKLAYSDAVELQPSSYGSSSYLFNKLICLFISLGRMGETERKFSISFSINRAPE